MPPLTILPGNARNAIQPVVGGMVDSITMVKRTANLATQRIRHLIIIRGSALTAMTQLEAGQMQPSIMLVSQIAKRAMLEMRRLTIIQDNAQLATVSARDGQIRISITLG